MRGWTNSTIQAEHFGIGLPTACHGSRQRSRNRVPSKDQPVQEWLHSALEPNMVPPACIASCYGDLQTIVSIVRTRACKAGAVLFDSACLQCVQVVYQGDRALSTSQQDTRFTMPSFAICSGNLRVLFGRAAESFRATLVPLKVPGQACHKQRSSVNKQNAILRTALGIQLPAEQEHILVPLRQALQQSLHPRGWVHVAIELGSRHEASKVASLLLNNAGARRLKCEFLDWARTF